MSKQHYAEKNHIVARVQDELSEKYEQKRDEKFYQVFKSLCRHLVPLRFKVGIIRKNNYMHFYIWDPRTDLDFKPEFVNLEIEPNTNADDCAEKLTAHVLEAFECGEAQFLGG